jgi:hypothetical protein
VVIGSKARGTVASAERSAYVGRDLSAHHYCGTPDAQVSPDRPSQVGQVSPAHLSQMVHLAKANPLTERHGGEPLSLSITPIVTKSVDLSVSHKIFRGD